VTHFIPGRGPRDNGLQAERTTFAWTRTSFAFLANGAVLTLKDLHGYGLGGLMPAGLAAAVALCTYLLAWQRQRTLRRRPLPIRIVARRPVYLVAVAVLLLIVVSAVAQPVDGHRL
jgi:lysylphosphatidylglycerol synthetase-like protein (DUF2156 family)